jgi:peptidoglycan-associated lipoprotein
LAGQAAWLNRRPGLSVTIQGHADDSESLELDRELSLRRAQAVRARLIELGVAPERIRIMAFGRAMQVAECAGPPCAAQNRRAVTVIDQTVAKAVPADAVPLLPYRLAPRRLH